VSQWKQIIDQIEQTAECQYHICGIGAIELLIAEHCLPPIAELYLCWLVNYIIIVYILFYCKITVLSGFFTVVVISSMQRMSSMNRIAVVVLVVMHLLTSL